MLVALLASHLTVRFTSARFAERRLNTSLPRNLPDQNRPKFGHSGSIRHNLKAYNHRYRNLVNERRLTRQLLECNYGRKVGGSAHKLRPAHGLRWVECRPCGVSGYLQSAAVVSRHVRYLVGALKREFVWVTSRNSPSLITMMSG